nr:helix-hairpin-helix domain-containing protein [uncultured Oscillibacter sp.]
MLGLTALFLAFLLALFFRDRAALKAAPVAVETERAVSQESFLPDVSPLDINTASAEELAGLPGIGRVLAERIVDYRAEHGPFGAEEDLMEVSGIGEKKLAELEGRITTGH